MEASRIFAAVMRYYSDAGYACLPEFSLRTNRRPDITCLNKQGHIIMIEVKSSLQDFRADQKWQDYQEWADAFYFAVGDDFPAEFLPDDSQCGIIITDGFDCHITQDAPPHKLVGTRRSHLTRRLAYAAMMRHYHLGLPDKAAIKSGNKT